MKVKNILPCICADHEATAADSVFYGMPRLYVSAGQRYSAYCPACGRGGSMNEHKSAYIALKSWNRMQTDLRTPVLFGGEDAEHRKQGMFWWNYCRDLKRFADRW